MLVFEEAQARISEVGCFSTKLEEVLLYMLKETQDIRDTLTKENEARKADMEKKCKDLQQSFQEENNRLKEIIKKENEERQRDMKDVEAYVKNENAQRKKEITSVLDTVKSEEEKRLAEAKAMEDKLAREKRELEEYLKKDALEHKQKMEAENKALKDKLDRDANELKKKMADGDDEKAEEMKIMQNRLDNERKMLSEKMERERAEIAEEMERAESERKSEANRIKNQMEEEKKVQENAVVGMFERMKGENETRKHEIHGLKDILVRENEKMQREQIALNSKLETGLGDLEEKLDKEIEDSKLELKKTSEELHGNMKTDKKELKDKLELDYDSLKRKVELETNELREKMQFDKKAVVLKLEEFDDDRQKEAKAIRNLLQKEREDLKETMGSEIKNMQEYMDGTTRDVVDLLKKEKGEREREIEICKRRIEDEKSELQATIDRDRDNMTKKMNEEHDQRRIEQLETKQRLENTEKSGKNDMVELFNRVKRHEEEARIDSDEVRQALHRTCSTLEEKSCKDRKEMRELVENEAGDLSKRMDKCNLERINDSADMQSKLAMLGKSASRHLEHLKSTLGREVQSLAELAGKPGSIVFNAYRDDGHIDGGECYVTFTGCNVNMGGAFLPKSGIFQCPEPGLYIFTLTVCTFDGKKCLLVLRKNEQDICAMIDQDGNENRGKTMISQTCFLELEASDRVQVYAVTGSGMTDTKSSHYTQFSGFLLRADAETYRSLAKRLAEDEEMSMMEGFRGFTPARGLTPTRGFTPSRGTTPTPGTTNGDAGQHVRKTSRALSPREEIPNGVDVKHLSNGVSHQPTTNGVEPKVAGKESPAKKDPTMKPLLENAVSINEEDEVKTQQSYLALTKLGAPVPRAPERRGSQASQISQASTNMDSPSTKKSQKQQGTPKNTPKQEQQSSVSSPKQAFYSFLGGGGK